MTSTRITSRMVLLAGLMSPVIAAGIFSLAAADDADSAAPGGPLLVAQADADTEKPEYDPANPHIGIRQYAGFNSCLRCHNSGIQGQTIELPGGEVLDLQEEQWVMYKEFPIWSKDDKHGQAYTVLFNERSQQMGKILGIAEIHRDRRCLACHTGFPLQSMPADENGLVAADLTKSLDVNLGVSCEGCHGPAGDAIVEGKAAGSGWLGPHTVAPALPYDKTNPWRFMSPQQKEQDYGYWDVRSPASKTQICASCHIGSVPAGRVVTHEMYAAGHPPLPGFEVETFVDQMPNHWREFSRKSEKVRDIFLEHTKDPLYDKETYSPESLHRTKSMLVGALVSLSDYLRLTGDLADETVDSPVPKTEWPELAQFDCYACHHDLKDPAWRQQRPPQLGTPGRPPLREWTTALIGIALRANGTDPQILDAKLTQLRQAVNAQPFGRPAAVAEHADAAADWLWTVAKELEKKQLTPKEGLAVLDQIATAATQDLVDYDSARQLTWAFRIVYEDLPAHRSTESDYRLGEVVGWFDNDSDLTEIEQQLQSLQEMFLLNLRKGREARTSLPDAPQARKTVEADLSLVLPFVADYDPATFQKRFERIHQLIRQPKQVSRK